MKPIRFYKSEMHVDVIKAINYKQQHIYEKRKMNPYIIFLLITK
jgi:hypothetical protein